MDPKRDERAVAMSLSFMSSRLPMVYQTEVTECGLASLTMIANFHGHDLDLNAMRRRFPVSMKGATLKSLITMAHQLSLGSRPLRLEIENLPELKLPAILHWDLDHFVVLKKIAGSKVHIHDPATGVRILNLSEVSNHFTGIALELSPTSDFTAIRDKIPMRLGSLWDKLIGWKRAGLQLLVLSVILQILILLAPFYLQLVVDEAINRFDPDILILLALGFGGLVIIQAVAKLIRESVILHFGYQMSYQMVANIFRHLLHLPTGFFEKRHIGDILSRMRSTTPIQTALTQHVVAAILDGVMAVVTGIVIFIYSPLLGFVVILTVLVFLIATFALYPAQRRAQEEMIVNEALENTHRIETIRASTAIKLFSAESQRLSVWRNLYADYVNSGLNYNRFGIWQRAIQDLMSGLQIIIVIYLGARLILDGGSGFTIGMLFAFMAYRQSFNESAVSLANKFVEFRLLSLHLERLSDIVQADIETDDSADPFAQSETGIGDISVANISFQYSPQDPSVLENLSFEIKAGAFVALSGPSGAGKTTLMKILLGLYSPTSGDIQVDGTSLTAENRTAWRRHVGVVMQDDHLLSGTIAENISFFDPDADQQKIEKVAKLARIHDEITAMPMGYLSVIGDMGSVLSGGQKQRVLLARALYRDPKVLFLDEGTANLDKDTEKLIVDIVADMPITRIIVAHRQEFLKRADQIIKIE